MLTTLLTVIVIGAGGPFRFSPEPHATARVYRGNTLWAEGEELRVRLPRRTFTITARFPRAPEVPCFPQRVRLRGKTQTVTVKCSIK